MNLALFFEGTGQGVHGKRTNVSLVYEPCLEDDAQRRHLEAGPGAHVGALLARHFAAWLDRLGIEVEYLGLWDTLDARLAWDSTTQSFDNAAANALVKPYIRKGWEF